MKTAVIIPTCDRPKLLRRAVNSVLAQEKKAHEIIVVNDGGDRFVFDGPVKMLETNRVGPTKARARAMEMLASDTEAVCYLDDDDELLPNHISALTEELEKAHRPFAFSRAIYRYADGSETEDPEPGNKDPNKAYYDPFALLRQNIAPISSFVHTRLAYEDVGGWDGSLLRMEDWDLWGRMFIHFGPPAYVDKVTNVIYKGLGANRTDSNPFVYAMSCHWRDIVEDRLKYLEEKGRGKLLASERHLFRVPKVGVVIPCYNAEKYVASALTSMRLQALFDQDGNQDFEIIAVDDGSTDRTWEILQEFKESGGEKIRLFRSPRNQGVTKTLNYGLLMSRSEYVARMDADDISLPDRLPKQVSFLDANPDVGILGTRFWSMDERLEKVHWANDVPTDPDEIAGTLLDRCCMGHPTVMMRRKVIETIGGYDEDPRCKAVEDYEFWLRASRNFKIANLPDYLLKYREYDGQVTRVNAEMQKKNFEYVRQKYREMRHG